MSGPLPDWIARGGARRDVVGVDGLDIQLDAKRLLHLGRDIPRAAPCPLPERSRSSAGCARVFAWAKTGARCALRMPSIPVAATPALSPSESFCAAFLSSKRSLRPLSPHAGICARHRAMSSDCDGLGTAAVQQRTLSLAHASRTRCCRGCIAYPLRRKLADQPSRSAGVRDRSVLVDHARAVDPHPVQANRRRVDAAGARREVVHAALLAAPDCVRVEEDQVRLRAGRKAAAVRGCDRVCAGRLVTDAPPARAPCRRARAPSVRTGAGRSRHRTGMRDARRRPIT